jgi:hypothetical protein
LLSSNRAAAAWLSFLIRQWAHFLLNNGIRHRLQFL